MSTRFERMAIKIAQQDGYRNARGGHRLQARAALESLVASASGEAQNWLLGVLGEAPESSALSQVDESALR